MKKNIRLTMHNGRVHKENGQVIVYNVDHNDRQFDLSKAKHIDAEMTSENYNFRVMEGAKTNLENEQKFYEKYFKQALEKQNEKHLKAGHKDRVKTIDDLRNSPQTCPEETLFYLGKKDNHYSREELLGAVKEFAKWHLEEFPRARILSIDLHVDEINSGPHIHLRKVWCATNSDRDWVVSQNKALEQMKVPRPFPNEEKSRFNNPKQTYTDICRQKMLEICANRGLELETTPREKSNMGKSKLEYEIEQLNNLQKEKASEIGKYDAIIEDKFKAVEKLSKAAQKKVKFKLKEKDEDMYLVAHYRLKDFENNVKLLDEISKQFSIRPEEDEKRKRDLEQKTNEAKQLIASERALIEQEVTKQVETYKNSLWAQKEAEIGKYEAKLKQIKEIATHTLVNDRGKTLWDYIQDEMNLDRSR